MSDRVEHFPLFPLGIVLLPSEIVPLHIFEEPYKLMIGECLEAETEFGILWRSDSGLCETGCSARITQVLDRLDDGRLNIVVEGRRPFRLLRRIEDEQYPAGDVEFVDERTDGDPQLAGEIRERYADLVERVTDERPDADRLTGLDAYGMAATFDFEPAAKQQLLELRSENERLERIGKLFTATVRRIDATERAGELARSNGRLHP